MNGIWQGIGLAVSEGRAVEYRTLGGGDVSALVAAHAQAFPISPA